jgi:hypothetical protein
MVGVAITLGMGVVWVVMVHGEVAGKNQVVEVLEGTQVMEAGVVTGTLRRDLLLQPGLVVVGVVGGWRIWQGQVVVRLVSMVWVQMVLRVVVVTFVNMRAQVGEVQGGKTHIIQPGGGQQSKRSVPPAVIAMVVHPEGVVSGVSVMTQTLLVVTVPFVLCGVRDVRFLITQHKRFKYILLLVKVE